MENKQILDIEFSEIDLESIFLSNAQSKVKRTSRSSILKQTKLMNVDMCETEDFDGKRKSQNGKRVSFADTFQVKELNTGNIYDIPGRNVLESSKESTLSIQQSNCSGSIDKENIHPNNFMRLSLTESTRQFNSKLCTISHKQVDEEKENLSLSESMILPDAVKHLPQSSTPYMYNNKWAEIANPQDMDITIIQSKESVPFDEENCHKTTEQSNSKLCTISLKQIDEKKENLSLSESMILPDAVEHLPQSSTPYMYNNKWAEIANPQDMDITIIQSKESAPFDEENCHKTTQQSNSKLCTIALKQVDEKKENLSLSESVILSDAVKHLPQSSTPYMYNNKWTEIANPQDMDITIIQSEESLPFDEENCHETCEIITSVSCITHSVQQSRLKSVTPEEKYFLSGRSKPEVEMSSDSNCIGYENYLTNEKLMMVPIAKHCQKNSFRVSSDNLACPFEDLGFQSPFRPEVLPNNFKLKAPVNVLKTETTVNNKCAANIEDVKDLFNPCVLDKRHFNLSLGFNNIHHMFEKNDYINLNKENMPLIALRENNFESSRTFENPATLQRLSDINNKKNMIKSVATNVLNKTKNNSEMDYTMLVSNAEEMYDICNPEFKETDKKLEHSNELTHNQSMLNKLNKSNVLNKEESKYPRISYFENVLKNSALNKTNRNVSDMELTRAVIGSKDNSESFNPDFIKGNDHAENVCLETIADIKYFQNKSQVNKSFESNKENIPFQKDELNCRKNIPTTNIFDKENLIGDSTKLLDECSINTNFNNTVSEISSNVDFNTKRNTKNSLVPMELTCNVALKNCETHVENTASHSSNISQDSNDNSFNLLNIDLNGKNAVTDKHATMDLTNYLSDEHNHRLAPEIFDSLQNPGIVTSANKKNSPVYLSNLSNNHLNTSIIFKDLSPTNLRKVCNLNTSSVPETERNVKLHEISDSKENLSILEDQMKCNTSLKKKYSHLENSMNLTTGLINQHSENNDPSPPKRCKIDLPVAGEQLHSLASEQSICNSILTSFDMRSGRLLSDENIYKKLSTSIEDFSFVVQPSLNNSVFNAKNQIENCEEVEETISVERNKSPSISTNNHYTEVLEKKTEYFTSNGMELTCHSVLQKQFQSGNFVDEEPNGQNILIPEQINGKESNGDSNISKICNFENSIPVSFSSQVMVSSTDLNHKKVAIITKEQLKQITHKTPDVVYSIRKMKKIKLNHENIINNESLENKHTKTDFPNQNFHPVTKCLFPEPVMTNKITQSLKLFSQSPEKGRNCSNDMIPLSFSTESTIYNHGIVQKEDIKEISKSSCHPNVDISELNILQSPNQGIKLKEKDSSILSDPIENVKDLSNCLTSEKTDPKDPVVAVRNFDLNKQAPILCSKLSSEVSINSDNLSLKENNDLKVLQNPSQNFESNISEVKKLCIPEAVEDVPDSSTIYSTKENTGSSCLHDSVQSTLSSIRYTPTSNPLDATKVILPKICDVTYDPSSFSCGEEKNSNNLLHEGKEFKLNGKNDSRIKADDSRKDAKAISKVDINVNDDISEVSSNNLSIHLYFEKTNSKSSPSKAERELSFKELKDINKLDADCRNSEISPNDENNICLEKTDSKQNAVEIEIELPFKKSNITKTSTEENNSNAHLCLEKREDSKLNIPETELECSFIDQNANVNPKSSLNGNEKLHQSPTEHSLKSYQPIIYPSHLPTEEKPEPINHANVSIETDLEESFAEVKNNISLEELQKKFVQASEGKKCRWKLITLDSNGGIFKLTWGPWLFKCSLLIYIQQENSNQSSIIFKKEDDESDRYTDLGYKVFEYLVQEKTIPCSIFCDKIILKLTEYSSIALKAEDLMRDILRISLSCSYMVSDDLNPFKISVEILNDKHKSSYTLSFSINLVTYPDDKIEPEIEHKLLKDVTNEVKQAVSLVEPGKNYLWNMVEAAEAL